jgi:CelD/BcsL family acetyltransferase involved in cellulose biosynthesis
MMVVRCVTSLREFDALASAWRGVSQVGGGDSPFLSHDWFACCWRTAGPDRRRELWVLEDAGSPVAFLPLTRVRTRVWGLPVRLLSFLECPDTPFVDIPTARRAEEVIPEFLSALRQAGAWDVLSFRKLSPESATLEALRAALAGRWPWREGRREASPCVEISGTWEDYLGQRSQRFRKTCRNIENRLEKSGTVTVEEHREVDPDGPIFAELMDVSLQSWKGSRGLAMVNMPGASRFFREFTRRASVNGWLRLWILRVDGRALATEYQVKSNGSLYALRADFDAGAETLSPGAVLNLRIVRSLFERQDVHLYNMGPGANPYKLRWATGSRETHSIHVYAPTQYGRMLYGLETRVLPALRRMREKVRPSCA